MKEQDVNKLLMEGDKLLESANGEANHPEEDVVAIMVCNNAKESLRKYLNYFLIGHNIEPDVRQSLEQLRSQCNAVDNRFKSIDFSSMRCGDFESDDDQEYCIDIGKVCNCLSLANQTKQLIYESIKS